MKVGILTFHCVPNFGAQLQAVSTIGYLKSRGFDPIILHWYPCDLENMYAKKVPQEQARLHLSFAEECMPISKLCRSEEDLLEEIDRLKIDAIFVGSDALFKCVPKIDCIVFSKRKLRYIERDILSVERLGNAFQGGFLSKTSKKLNAVAFSVSSQNSPYFRLNEYEKNIMKKCMSNYLKISTRDEWTRDMVSSITGRSDIDVTPDPVFAFNQNNYLKIPEKEELLAKYNLPEKYVLFSFWGNRLSDRYFKDMANGFIEKGLTPVALSNPEMLKDCGLKHVVNLPLSPIEWYALIKYSKGYIGERMHPIVVSLHNAVPFFSFDPYGIVKKTFWGLFHGSYLPESSKTYHIVKASGFEEYNYSYLGNEKLPRADEIVKKILMFPIEKCKQFAQKQQEKYNHAMENILRVL